MSTKKQIIELLKEKGIRGYSKKNKAELLVLLNECKPQEPKVKKEKVKNFEDKTLKTEDTGKIAEMAVCLFYGIEYNGGKNGFKYNIKEAKRLSKLIPLSLKDEWSKECIHTAKQQGTFDFTSTDEKYLNVKSNQLSGTKIAPGGLGQYSIVKFRNYFKIPQPEDENNDDDVREYVINNITSVLKEYWKCMFDQSTLYYSEKDDTFTLYKPNKACPKFKKEDLTFSKLENWGRGTSLSWKNKNLGEFQIHGKRSSNLKFRWNKNIMINPEVYGLKKSN